MTTKRTALITLLTLTSAAVPAAPAAAEPSRVAYFEVSASARQNVNWSESVLASGGCATVRMIGQGGSWLRLHTPAPQVAVARQIGNESRVQFIFKPYLHVKATLQREGKMVNTLVTGGQGCPPPLDPVASDCGVRQFPRDTRISLAYDAPDNWPGTDGPAPLVPSLHISGPYAPEWLGRPLYQNCSGEQSDDVLGVDYLRAYGRDTGAAALSMKELFGTRKAFTVNGFLKKTEQYPLGSGMSGTHPVTTELKWSVTFTRIARSAARRFQ